MPSIAPFVAAFRRRLANLPGPAQATGEASNGEPVTVELLVAGEWIDLTVDGYVLVRDDNGQIRITYGITGGEGSQTERGQAQLQLKNTDGRFSPATRPARTTSSSAVTRRSVCRCRTATAASPTGSGGGLGLGARLGLHRH